MKELKTAIKKWLLSKLHVCEYVDKENYTTNYTDRNGTITKITQTYVKECKTCGKIYTKTIIFEN